MKLLVTTSNKSAWTLKTFAHLWNRYFSPVDDVDVLCETLQSVVDLKLPSNFHPVQAGESWALNQWSDGLIRYLNGIPDQQVLIMLDDYWLTRQVDVDGIDALDQYLQKNPNVLRVDLTSDRLYASGPRYPHEDPNYATHGYYDLVNRPKTQYQMSLMPGLWNKAALLSVLRVGWNPWDVEIAGPNVVNESDLIVVGTRQNPIKIVNSLRNASVQVDLRGLNDEVKVELRSLGHLPPDKEYLE